MGQAEKGRTVPGRLQVERSDFFKAACSKQWNEATEREVQLPEIEVEVFDDYLHLAHNGKVETLEQGSASDDGFVAAMWSKYIELWIAADRLLDSELRNAVIDAVHVLCLKSNHFPTSLRSLKLGTAPPRDLPFGACSSTPMPIGWTWRIFIHWADYLPAYLPELFARSTSAASHSQVDRETYYLFSPRQRDSEYYH